jgi:hypothetical protein
MARANLRWPTTTSRNWLEPELFFCPVSRLPEGPLPRSFTFKDSDKIRELARRGQALRTSETKQLLEYAIEQGRGGLYLHLTPDQYRKLRS